MRLLITTQAVDTEDHILGFFHNWIRELSDHFESIEVICLKEGAHTLPPHVHVHSLGKEHGENRIKYSVRFIYYAWKLRDRYDVIFSHMNPHYIVMMGWFWFILGKPMFFWRNHARMNLMTRIAAFFARHVFYTSPFACTRVFKHSVQMPVGIDTSVFHPREGVAPTSRSVLFLGRVSAVKRPELFVEAATYLRGYSPHLFGDEPSQSGDYRKRLERIAQGSVTFHGGVPNHETPALYCSHEVYVNLTSEGSMDKTVLEAAACGTLPLVSNKSFESYLPQECILQDTSPQSIASGIEVLCNLPEDKKRAYRNDLVAMVVQKHSLKALAKKLVPLLTKK